MKNYSDRLKETFKTSLAFGYAAYLNLMNAKRRKVILYYHEINREHAARFKEQMKYLSDSYKVVKPSEIRSICAENDQTLIAITIDDAFESVYEFALPILKDYNLPAAVFAPVGCLGKRPKWNIPLHSMTRQYRIMTDKQLLDTDRQGFEVFSHTYSHPMLTEVDSKGLAFEVVRSKQILEELLGHEVEAISYPHGDHNETVRNFVMRSGYKLGFTVSPRMVDDKTDPMRIGRFKVSPDEAMPIFKLKCSGAFQVLANLYSLKAALPMAFNI